MERLVRSCTPDGMMDLLNHDAANWDATPFHDNYFQEDLDTEAGAPSQFVKYAAERAITPEFCIQNLNPGKIFSPDLNNN